MTKLIFFFGCVSLLAFSSCKKGSNTNNITPVCDGSSPTYDANVETIISGSCIGCHGFGSSNGDMSTYAALSQYTANGSFEKEVLTNQSMPTSGPLAESQLNLIKCWVENGFPEN
ncbi:MAG: hypothetical protein ACI865_002039 [Flavobacteriaceae bacterium]|jgi:hypothetical protein